MNWPETLLRGLSGLREIGSRKPRRLERGDAAHFDLEKALKGRNLSRTLNISAAAHYRTVARSDAKVQPTAGFRRWSVAGGLAAEIRPLIDDLPSCVFPGRRPMPLTASTQAAFALIIWVTSPISSRGTECHFPRCLRRLPSLHEDWDRIDLHMTASWGSAFGDKDMLDGTRRLTREKSSAGRPGAGLAKAARVGE